MAQLAADLFVSLDGFAAGEDVGPFFGYGGPELSEWIASALEDFPAILMGRVTYEALSGFSASASDDVSRKMTQLEKIVFSKTLQGTPVWSNTHFLRGELGPEIAALKRERRSPMRTIGSLSLVRNLMQLRLLDRLRIVTFPIVLGPDGREPFLAANPRTALELLTTRTLDSRLVLSEYRPE